MRILLFLIAATAWGQQIESRSAVLSGTTLPSYSGGQCRYGEKFFKTDAPAGQNLYMITDTSTCTWTQQGGSGSSTKSYWFGGVSQAGVSAWSMNYDALTNMVFATTDSTHKRAALVVTANTTGSALLSITPVVTTNPSVQFVADVRSTDGTNAGSMALSYACVAAGSSVDNPSTTALTAISLTTIASTKSVYTSTQSVTCSGSSSSPADLYIFWTPTAPSGGTLTLLRLGLVY